MKRRISFDEVSISNTSGENGYYYTSMGSANPGSIYSKASRLAGLGGRLMPSSAARASAAARLWCIVCGSLALVPVVAMAAEAAVVYASASGRLSDERAILVALCVLLVAALVMLEDALAISCQWEKSASPLRNGLEP